MAQVKEHGHSGGFKEPKHFIGAKESAPVQPAHTHEQIMTITREQARLAVERLRDFILTGNRNSADEFLRIYDAETLSDEEERAEAFNSAFMAEFRRRVIEDGEAGPVFSAFWTANPTAEGGVDLTVFVAAVGQVYQAALSGEASAIEALRQQYGTEFVNPLLSIWERIEAAEGPEIGAAVPIPVRIEEQTQTDAARAAELFGRYIRATAEEDREGHDQDYYREQLMGVFRRYRAGGDIEADFLLAFARALGGRERDVWDRFIQRERIEGLSFANFEELVGDIRDVTRELRATEQFVNLENLRQVYGNSFVSALQALMPRERPIRLASIEDVRNKIGAIREFAQEHGLDAAALEFGGRTLSQIEEELRRIEEDEEVDQEALNELSSSIPSRRMLEREIQEARRIAGMFNVLMNGTRPYYFPITQGWLSMARSLVSQADNRSSDGHTGDVFAALFAQEMERLELRMDDMTVTGEGGATSVRRGVRSSIERVANVLPMLMNVGRMLNGDFDEEEMESTERMIEELPDDLFPEEVREQMMSGYESVVRSVEEPQYSPRSIMQAVELIRDASSSLGRGLQDRVLMATVSAWHYELAGLETGEASRLEALEGAYRQISRSGTFSEFQGFMSDFQSRLEREAEAVPERSREEEPFRDILLRDSRTRLQNASGIFRNCPLEVRFAIFQLARAVRESRGDQELTSEDVDKLAALINGVEGMPSAYAALLISRTGMTLFSDYDGRSIEAIVSAINTYSQPLINAGLYRDLEAYYESLPERIRSLFVDVIALRNAAREDEGALRDVRVRLPTDRPDVAEMYMPASRIVISLPKHIYEQWEAQGMVVHLSRAPDVSRGVAQPPDLNRMERTFFGTDAIQVGLNIPMPYLYLPLVLENLGELAPRVAIPVEDMNELFANASGAVHIVRGPDTDYESYSVSETAGQRGGGREWSESFYATAGDGTEHYLGNIRWRNQPLGRVGERRTMMTQGDIDVDVRGSDLDRMLVAMEGSAPSGTDTAVYFRMEGDEYRGYVFQRFPGGSFGLVDVRTFTTDEAQVIYDHTFANQPWRLYGGGRIAGGDASRGERDWMLQMDGAVIFGGVGEAQFQGAGAAVQVGRGGGAVDYEETRGRRVGALGAYMDPTEREYYVGRIFISEIEESAEHPGVGLHGEFQYFRAQRGTVDVFLGSRRIGAEGVGPENIDAGMVLGYLGDGWWAGGRGGYMMSEMIRPAAAGSVPSIELVRQQVAGGSAYGGADLRALSTAAAVSAVWTRMLSERPEDVDEEEWRRHVSAAMRFYIPAIRTRLAGGYVDDEDHWVGGHGIASLLYPTRWLPELSAFGIYLRSQGEEFPTLPIVGGTGEVAAGSGVRFRAQGFGVIEAGGGADIRAFFGEQQGVDLSVNGVYTEELEGVGRGVSGAVRLRLGDEDDQYRLRATVAGGYTEEERGGEEMHTIEAGGVVRVEVAQPGEEPTLTDVYVGAAAIHTEVTPLADGEEERSGTQVDVQVGVEVGTTDSNLDLSAGVQYWEAGDDQRLYLFGRGTYELWRGEGYFQSVQVQGALNGMVWEEGGSTTSDYNFSVNLRLLGF